MYIVYVDFTDFKNRGGGYVITSLTWITTEWANEDAYEPHHYHINYDGVSDVEDLFARLFDHKKMVRYSSPTVFSVFRSSIPKGSLLVVDGREKKNRLLKYFAEHDIFMNSRGIVLMEEVCTTQESMDEVYDRFESARLIASDNEGNSL